jgi:hypothetical protein
VCVCVYVMRIHAPPTPPHTHSLDSNIAAERLFVARWRGWKTGV